MDNDVKEIIESVKSDILEAIRDIKKEIERLHIRMDSQNDKIISASKDIEYLKLNFDGEIVSLTKDLDECWNAFRKFKEEELCGIIEKKQKTVEMKIKLTLAIAALIAISNVLLFVLEILFRGNV